MPITLRMHRCARSATCSTTSFPWFEASYPVKTEPDDRLLVGFSKSGWGAWSLLLRHPGVFGKAAAWDAPLMQDAPNRFGMQPIFGGRENFERYRIAGLIHARAHLLRQRCRLVLTGYSGSFRAHHAAMHELLVKLAIPHEYRDGPRREHQWHSGWLDEAVSIVAKGCGANGTGAPEPLGTDPANRDPTPAR